MTTPFSSITCTATPKRTSTPRLVNRRIAASESFSEKVAKWWCSHLNKNDMSGRRINTPEVSS
jgi:hypothetical protein